MSTTDGGFSWTAKSNGPSETLYDILPLSAEELYAVGGYGTIIRSTDGGETWEEEHTGVKNALYAITRVNDGDTLWAVGQFGTVLRCPVR